MTPINRAWIDNPRPREVESHIPMARAAEPARSLRCSRSSPPTEASYITGQTIFACGGLTLYPDFAWRVLLVNKEARTWLYSIKRCADHGREGRTRGDVTKAFCRRDGRWPSVPLDSASDFRDARFTAFPAELSDGGAGPRKLAEDCRRLGKIDILVQTWSAVSAGRPANSTETD